MALLLNQGDVVLRSYSYTKPSPTHPIQPEFVGVRTAQLFDKAKETAGKYIDSSGNEQTSGTGLTSHSDYIPITSGTQYTLSVKKHEYANFTIAISWYNQSKTFITRDSQTLQTPAGVYALTKTAPNNAAFAIVNYFTYETAGDIYCMFNSGSTALPYEQFGYKIPLTCAGQTVPVYLGQTQTVRRIKKLVLTGEETYAFDAPYSRFITVLPNAKIEGLRLTQLFCTHFISVHDGRPISEVSNNSIYSSDAVTNRFFIKTTDYTSTTDFKSYLAAQYANGTPVTVWYVLATPQTGIVNEPLAKIGDYADELHSTDAAVTIPTVKGQNTLTVDTALAPSSLTIKGHVKEMT